MGYNELLKVAYVPLDPDVAEYMGAFTEDAIALRDMIEDAPLTINGQ